MIERIKYKKSIITLSIISVLFTIASLLCFDFAIQMISGNAIAGFLPCLLGLLGCIVFIAVALITSVIDLILSVKSIRVSETRILQWITLVVSSLIIIAAIVIISILLSKIG